MNKAILKSESPKRCEQIASGKCTVLLSKTKPKLEPPFKCYIYATKPKKFIKGYADDDLFRHVDGRIECGFSFQLATEKGATPENNILSGKVIGEFVCDKVIQVKNDSKYSTVLGGFDIRWNIDTEKTGLTDEQLNAYCGEPIDFVHTDNVSTAIFKAWALHISQLKIYDTPRELGEFKAIKRCKDWRYFDMCSDVCGYAENNQCHNGIITKRVIRPPQSWMYVQELNS